MCMPLVSAGAAEKSVPVVYARRNISDGATISADDLAETLCVYLTSEPISNIYKRAYRDLDDWAASRL
jgi:hypothetical protein